MVHAAFTMTQPAGAFTSGNGMLAELSAASCKHLLWNTWNHTYSASVTFILLLFSSKIVFISSRFKRLRRLLETLTSVLAWLLCLVTLVTEQSDKADESLLHAVLSDNHHVLYHLLPASRSQRHKLRPRTHSFTLTCKSSFYDNWNFITRMLFCHAYWH